MKTLRSCLQGGQFIILSVAILAREAPAFAQTTGSNLVPVVTVLATQPVATVTNSGVFTVFRAGNTNFALNVWYDLGGTASNGVDYAAIPEHVVEIAAGATQSIIPIAPMKNTTSSVVKTVALTLTNAPTLSPANPVNYGIGSPSQATIYIEANGATNLPPSVSIFEPPNGVTFYTPTNIQILAKASDLDGSVTNVKFFAGAMALGSGTPVVLDPPGVNGVTGLVYLYNWLNPPAAGSVPLSAVATDNGGLSTTSAPVNITVSQGMRVLNIYRPTNGATFFGPVDVPIYATASASNGIASVEFFADGQDLGPGVLDGCVTAPLAVPICIYSLVWSNAPVGDHVLTAVLTDDVGLSTTSLPVNITVLQGPLTNPPTVIRIISPPNGAVFRAPINLPLLAFFTYPHGSGDWAGVGFYDGTNFLGTAYPVATTTPLPVTPGSPTPVPVPVSPTALPTNIYELVWTNAPVGNHVVTAEAGGGNSNSFVVWRIVSSPVNITILPPLPPPTNRPPIVSIVATDPVAIEGTNSWIWRGETNSPPTWAAWPTAVCRCYTNCAPKTATFTVRRLGDTNDDLTVNYDIGGTASNGVDYVALPGFVTIPAGDRHALITVVPIDDGPPDANKTVVLTLMASTNTPPDYWLGFPRRAAAVIIDSNGPRPETGMLPGHWFHLAMPGPDAAWFAIEYSTNLANWTPICTNQVIDGSIDFVDPDAASSQSRFYRAVPLGFGKTAAYKALSMDGRFAP
jgi:Bacterial Ig domain/Calx-beta domain